MITNKIEYKYTSISIILLIKMATSLSIDSSFNSLHENSSTSLSCALAASDMTTPPLSSKKLAAGVSVVAGYAFQNEDSHGDTFLRGGYERDGATGAHRLQSGFRGRA